MRFGERHEASVDFFGIGRQLVFIVASLRSEIVRQRLQLSDLSKKVPRSRVRRFIKSRLCRLFCYHADAIGAFAGFFKRVTAVEPLDLKTGGFQHFFDHSVFVGFFHVHFFEAFI